jgi:hypothetical protein
MLNSQHNFFSHTTQIYTLSRTVKDRRYKSFVVYRINCRNCASFYIGNTMQYLKTRVGQHKTTVNPGNSDYSALVEHALQSGHQINWVDYAVVTTDTYSTPLIYLKPELVSADIACENFLTYKICRCYIMTF